MTTYALPRSLSIRTIRNVHQSITEWIGESDHHVLDGEAVDEIDVSGIQLIAALISANAINAPRATLINPSKEMQAAFQLCGLPGLTDDVPTDTPEKEDQPR